MTASGRAFPVATVGIGLVIQIVRKILQRSGRYQVWRIASDRNKALDFVIDAILVASPYASSFGGFVEFTTALWFGLGGISASVLAFFAERRKIHASGSPGEGEALPEDMSSSSLIGGGLSGRLIRVADRHQISHGLPLSERTKHRLTAK